ncbi:peptidoglycan-binding domain-containing protein [Devosia sp. ZB163]|uniref:peptidoglycan-binding domain-containing protein n=1 Tax=Devosia sp. ZB163 TaxID=3025938 RepID=UPI00235F1C3A|nr:peptidoglycan-binding domain-containing protein [Devosia sp. ZB163]MDC9823743.1 peptidoglycan-binding domain-containing protein [Devosia sp. ZB163]
MTAASLAHLPMQVGGVALAHTGRAALWVIARYMRAPLTNSAIALLVATTAMAGSNALYGQRHEHPAPLFTAAEEMTTGSIEMEPVIPKTRPKSFAMGTPVKLKSVAATEPVATSEGPIGNKDVFEVQRKLEQLQLFTGTVDGYYGPQTARAIRKFEEQRGLRPMGELSREVIAAILAAPLSTPEPAPVPAPAPAPAATVEPKPAVTITLPKVQAAPVGEVLAPAEAVQPQSLAAVSGTKPLAAVAPAPKVKQASPAPKLLGRPVPETPEQALEMAADTAGDAINTIIDGVQSMTMTTPPKKPAAQAFAAQAKATANAVAEAAAPIALVPRTQQLAALPDNPQVGVPLKIEEEAPKPGETIAVLDTDATPDQVKPISVTDPVVVAKIQRGLASLGFLHGPADGVAGEATAKAIRNFEVYFNYKVTGRITPELMDLLVDNGAVL